jgi:HPt (histidine-containing phosphotransfer) domain-containing protein
MAPIAADRAGPLPVLDPACLDDLAHQLGDVAPARETVLIFLHGVDARRTQLVEAVMAADLGGVRLVAHSLASVSALLGARDLHNLSLHLEASALLGDLDDVTEVWPAFEVALDRAADALRDWLAAAA